MTTPSPKLKAAGLWEKTSAAANRYFVGRLGGVRILIFENRDRGAEGEPDWVLFFADGNDNREESSSPSHRTARRQSPHPSRQRQTRSPVQPDSVPMFDDPVDDLWPGRDGRDR